MPWQPDESSKFNHSLHSKRQREVWASIANEALAKHGDEGRAIRTANSALKARHAAKEQK